MNIRSLCFSRELFTKTVLRLMQKFPAVQVELITLNGLPDLTKNRLDIAFQTLGLRDLNYISHKLRFCRSVLRASKQYLEQKGTPSHPTDLTRHELIGQLPMTLPMRLKNSKESIDIEFSGQFSSNSASVILDAVRLDFGIGILTDLTVLDNLRGGQLIQVLPDWLCPLTEKALMETKNERQTGTLFGCSRCSLLFRN